MSSDRVLASPKARAMVESRLIELMRIWTWEYQILISQDVIGFILHLCDRHNEFPNQVHAYSVAIVPAHPHF